MQCNVEMMCSLLGRSHLHNGANGALEGVFDLVRLIGRRDI
jgi:hypothetical protein